MHLNDKQSILKQIEFRNERCVSNIFTKAIPPMYVPSNKVSLHFEFQTSLMGHPVTDDNTLPVEFLP